MKATTLPPCAIEAERAYLGALLLRGLPACVSGGKMDPRWFFDPRHMTVFAAISRLVKVGRPFDVVMVYDELGAKREAVGGLSFLSDLLDAAFTDANVYYYASRIRETWMLRCLRNLAGELAISAVEEPSEWIMTAKHRLEELATTWKEIK